MTPSLTLGPCPARIIASATAFPPAIDTATLFEALTPTLPADRRAALLDHYTRELGVLSRGHLPAGADPLELPLRAARDALAETPSTKIAAVILATSTASRWTTAESARLANALGLDVAFFDVRSGCTGGLWALIEGARLARDTGAPILVVGCDSFSRAFSPHERLLPLAMGDGAAALVLAPATDGGLLRAVMGGAPAHVDLATVRAPLPPVDLTSFVLSGDPEPFAHAAEAALVAALNALDPSDALIAPHVGRITTAHRLGQRFDRPVFVDGFTQHGNLGAASLITALHLLSRRAEPALVALASAGGGLSYGAALWRLEGAV